MIFIEKLIQSIRDKKSVVCMGLDPRMDSPGQIPDYLREQFNDHNEIIFEFNKALIDSVYDLIPVIKPQIAFYEKYEALKALKETISYAHKKDLLVILDAKRNDIGSTSEAYAYSIFNNFRADSTTLNAYLGIDGIDPFLSYEEKGLFILVKTSNPSSKDFQDLFSVKLDEVPISEISFRAESILLERNYIQMAKLVNEWGKTLPMYSNYHNLGVVVGATFPMELKEVRTKVPHSFILIPGYGAQGAQAKDIKYGFDKNGLGAIINSARGIMFAYNKHRLPPEKFAQAAKQEVIEMNEKINSEINL